MFLHSRRGKAIQALRPRKRKRRQFYRGACSILAAASALSVAALHHHILWTSDSPTDIDSFSQLLLEFRSGSPSTPTTTVAQRLPILCGACAESNVNETTTCEALIEHELTERATIIEMRQIQQRVVTEYESCRPCALSMCPSTLDVAVPYDETAPKILRAVTPFLESIPDDYRLSLDLLSDPIKRSAYFETSFPEGSYLLHTFNPSIVPTPENVREELAEAVYLTSFRVSPLTPCMSDMYDIWKFGDKEFLGFALMDRDLNILREVVVDVNAVVQRQSRIKYQDVRLFYLHGKQLYLSSKFMVMPVKVHASTGNLRAPGHQELLPPVFNRTSSGNNMEVITQKDGVQWVHPIKQGKNFQFFHSKGHPDDILMEEWPEAPREVRRATKKSYGFKVDDKIVSFGKGSTLSTSTPPMSFTAHDRVNPFEWRLRARGRGSACCIRLDKQYFEDLVPPHHPALEYDYLLAGVAHIRTFKLPDMYPFAYMSKLYAFVPEDDFHVVARSGHFCLGFTTEPTKDPFAAPSSWTVQRKLFLNQTYDGCPHVHFVSGITEVVGDDSQVIISYGVNDCSPRFVFVEKRALAERIFLPMLGKEGVYFGEDED